MAKAHAQDFIQRGQAASEDWRKHYDPEISKKLLDVAEKASQKTMGERRALVMECIRMYREGAIKDLGILLLLAAVFGGKEGEAWFREEIPYAEREDYILPIGRTSGEMVSALLGKGQGNRPEVQHVQF